MSTLKAVTNTFGTGETDLLSIRKEAYRGFLLKQVMITLIIDGL
jgi:hypothetical protein